MSSDRIRQVVLAAIIVLAGACWPWPKFGATKPAPTRQPTPSILYADYEVTLDGEWVLMGNTGMETLAAIQIRFEAYIVGSSGLGTRATGHSGIRNGDLGNVLRVGVPCAGGRVRAFRFSGGACSASSDRIFRLRHDDLTGPPKLGTDLETEVVGFDPDLRAATDTNKGEIEAPPTPKK